MKTMKKLSALVLALVMVFAMSATASAATKVTADAEGKVTITLQSVDKNGVVTNLGTEYVAVVDGDTVKDVVNAILGDNVATCESCEALGCVHAYDANYEEYCPSCSTCNCTWKKVAEYAWSDEAQTYVPTGTYGSALNSMNYSKLYTTWSKYTNLGGGLTLYEGEAWEYYVNNNYESRYMDKVPVSNGDTILLTYNYSSFTY